MECRRFVELLRRSKRLCEVAARQRSSNFGSMPHASVLQHFVRLTRVAAATAAAGR